MRSVTEPRITLSFRYDADRNLVKQVRGGAFPITTWYLSRLYEKRLQAGNTIIHQHYLEAGGEIVALHRTLGTTSAANPLGSHTFTATYYQHRDHLGSVAAMTDSTQQASEQLMYDAWGQRRLLPWRASGLRGLLAVTRRGFTDHTMLDPVNLVHMGGRVYDPCAGRFLSADPYIQDALNSQNYNRYSYVLNNPLSYTDPTGFHHEGGLQYGWGAWSFGWGAWRVGRSRPVIRVRLAPRSRHAAASAAVSPMPGLSAAATGFTPGLAAHGDDFRSGPLSRLTGAAAGIRRRRARPGRHHDGKPGVGPRRQPRR